LRLGPVLSFCVSLGLIFLCALITAPLAGYGIAVPGYFMLVMCFGCTIVVTAGIIFGRRHPKSRASIYLIAAIVYVVFECVESFLFACRSPRQIRIRRERMNAQSKHHVHTWTNAVVGGHQGALTNDMGVTEHREASEAPGRLQGQPVTNDICHVRSDATSTNRPSSH
jgi:hypothetical protein